LQHCLDSQAALHSQFFSSHLHSIFNDSISASRGKTKAYSPKPQGKSYIKEYNNKVLLSILVALLYYYKEIESKKPMTSTSIDAYRLHKSPLVSNHSLINQNMGFKTKSSIVESSNIEKGV
jgi:hypothetical protein